MNLSAPLDTQIEVTSSCNYSCIYCYNVFEHKPFFMSKPQIERVLRELDSNNVFSYIFTGGEPFQNREVLMAGLRYMQERGRDIFINTNLSLPISAEEIEVLKRVNNILFSIPSSDPNRYARITRGNGWKNFLANLETLASRGVVLTGNQVVIEDNEREISDIALFLKNNFNIRNFCVTPVNPSGISRCQYTLPIESYDRIARTLLDVRRDLDMHVEMLVCLPLCLFSPEVIASNLITNSCSAGKSTSAIGADGEVRRCIQTKKGYGNIFREPFREIWGRIVSEEFTPQESCRGCSVDLGCEFGCESRKLIAGGKDPLIRGPIGNYSPPIIEPLLEDDKCAVKTFRYREERPGIFIITDSQSFLIDGNLALVNFLKDLARTPFTLAQVRKRFGAKGEGLMRYLNERRLFTRI